MRLEPLLRSAHRVLQRSSSVDRLRRCGVIGVALLPLAATVGALAADAPSTRPAAKASAAAPTAQRRADRAKGMALPTETVQRIGEAQLRVADRVLTGDAECDQQQKVSVEPVHGQPGHFKLRFRNHSYTMVPEETSSGAVRLEDKKAGMVWLQIPSKSMLMNARAGQRVADGCLHPEQRAALAAAQAAAAAASKP